mmetsp:Transcript_3316/g.7765  ORF Transcript_3316/g.7765 Transcript_3316/m.7765 type:complete len:265 (-) Transcript_3316:302-1096(-)|eukprot:CAMPEP_0114522444 /NCGR_PEP_ID=MMETSP0109-20121206/20743_1 /TAXON_ID=29199 /ORGANISM="Chlorarachnion reptans, Strain CCCM449" /LENGTH=264 /DNA_ID=CAMNT_0001703657 /DNA_START=184 /DNA_END=978 /DNA_ORIENTATION=+
MEDKVEESQVAKCIEALFKLLEAKNKKEDKDEEEVDEDDEAGEEKEIGRKQKLQLFEDDEFVYIQIGLRMPPNKKRVNPYRIPIKHSLYAGTEICLFTKSPSSVYEGRLDDHPVDEVKAVIDVSTLRTDYRQYEDKRNLMALYDLFLADEGIVTLLPPLIGKTFFKRGKQPIPIKMKSKNFSPHIVKARDSTYLYMRSGNCVSLKVGKTSFSEENIVENVMCALPVAVSKIPGKWKSVQNISLKTTTSLALPIYKEVPKETRIE